MRHFCETSFRGIFSSIDQDATLFIAVLKATKKSKNIDSLIKVHVSVGSETIIKLRCNDTCVNPHLWMSRYVFDNCYCPKKSYQHLIMIFINTCCKKKLNQPVLSYQLNSPSGSSFLPYLALPLKSDVGKKFWGIWRFDRHTTMRYVN